MKEILNNLFEHRTLTRSQAREILSGIGKGEYNPGSVAAFLSVYLMRSISVEELAGFRDALLELCLPVKLDATDTVDIVGTGGDGKNTFNISTLSCFVAAGAGIKVTKHGNYGVSSVSGSSNVLESIGIRFSNDSNLLNRQVNEAGVCFMHAPMFHPAMKTVAPVRKELGVRTFFNLLGPVVNPCRPKAMLLGTYNLEILRLYNYLLQETEQRYMLVHSFDGYDEVSLTGPFKKVTSSVEEILHASDLGMVSIQPEELSGGKNTEEAAGIFMAILKGEGTTAQHQAVVANAALAIQCARPEYTLETCLAMAQESLEGMKAYQVYRKLLELNPTS